MYAIPAEQILTIGKKALNEVDYLILEKHLHGKTTNDIISELSDYRLTPYLVCSITIRWLSAFRKEPQTGAFHETNA